MTPEEIYTEYLRRERAQARTPRGQDPSAIIEAIAAENGMDSAEVTEIVMDHTVYRAC